MNSKEDNISDKHYALLMQAFSTRKEGEDAFVRMREALDSIEDKPLAPDYRVLVNRSQEQQANGILGHHNQQLNSCTEENTPTSDSSGLTLHNDSDKNEAQMPSDLITSCVATLLMIQVTFF